MGKFKPNAMKPITNNTPKNIGAGLLNDTSKDLKAPEYIEDEYIKLTDIQPTKLVDYSKKEEEMLDLMASIYNLGLQQNPVVIRTPDGEKPYRLTTGNRRFEAIKRLHERGDWGDTVKCTIIDLNKINLPLTEKLKEKYAIMETNSKVRHYTDYDKLMEVREYDEFYTELRKQGYEFVEEADGKRLQLKGVKNRQLIAEKLQMSPAQVGKFSKVSSKAAPETIEALKQEVVNINVATEVVDLSPEDQKEIVQEVVEANTNSQIEETLTTEKVVEFKEKKAKEVGALISISHEQLLKDVKELEKLLPVGNLEITEKVWNDYNKSIQKLKNIINKMS